MKLSNVPEGHKKSEAFFRENEKGFRSEASKPFRKSKAFSKSLEKTKFFQKKTNNLFGILLIGLLLTSTFVSANGEHSHESQIEEAKALIESKVSCDELSDEQLETIGEYYMEQMHPGEAHEAMHKMMGMEEGTEYHEQVHVNMAKMMYCGEGGMMGKGMMGSGGMMNMMGNKAYDYKKSGGMMNMIGNWPFSWLSMGFGFVFMILFWGLIIWLIVWIITRYAKPQTGKTESAMEILKKRFAKGEITKKQYEEMKKEIS